MLVTILILIICFIGLLVLNVPIAFSIGISTLITMLLTFDFSVSMMTVAQRMFAGLDSFALLALPFFILSGQIIRHGGIARRLIEFAKVVLGFFPGGLALVNILACMLMGSISGSAVAATSAIGSFMIPKMNEEGYDKDFNTALNAAASTTGLLIPPSNIMIVYGVASGGVSIAALFVAGYAPGILVGLGLMIIATIIAMIKKYPTCRPENLKVSIVRFLDAIPSLFLIFLVIGGIISGIFTATEASVIAVLYALALSIFYREIDMKSLQEILVQTVMTTSVVMILIAVSTSMSWILAVENIPQYISTALVSISDQKWVILLIVNLILLFVGAFIDMTPAVLIFTPIFLPIMKTLGISPLHFGIIMILNLCIGLCTPPVGTVLFVGCGIGKTTIAQIVRPLLLFLSVMIAVLMLITYVPAITTWLPHLFDMI